MRFWALFEAAVLNHYSGLFNSTYECAYQESPAFTSNPEPSFVYDFVSLVSNFLKPG